MDTRWGMQYELGMCHKFLPEPGDKLNMVHITRHEQAEEKGQAMLHVETWILPRLLRCTQHLCTLLPTILFAARHGLQLGNLLVTSKTSILVCTGDVYNKTRSFPKDLPIPTSLITQ